MAEGNVPSKLEEPSDVACIVSDDPEDIAKHNQWECKQQELKAHLSQVDSPDVLSWQTLKGKFDRLRYVAGVDISFNKDNNNKACAMLVVLSFPTMEVG